MGSRTIWLDCLLLLSFFVFLFHAENLGSIQLTKRLNFTGYLRNRYWNFYSSIPFVDSSLSRNYISYLDLFLRNRFKYSISKKIAIQVVFDIYTIYGQTSGGSIETRGGSLGKPGFNLTTRNLFLSVQPFEALRFQLGLLPFSLPGGYVLAKDGAGIQIEYTPDISILNPYLFWIKAIENSITSSQENGLEPHDIRDDDILVFGNRSDISNWLRGNIYYIFRNDLNQDDSVSGRLHWLGLNTNSIWRNFQVELSCIYNFGELKVRSNAKDVSISSFLWGIYLGYEIGNLTLGTRGEGATGANAGYPYTKDAFQTIGVSRGLSKILIDDSGGLAVRGGGSLYGINSSSLELLWRHSTDLEVGFKVFYFLLLNRISGSSRSSSASRDLGIEMNFSLDYRIYANLEIGHTFAAFYPLKGYFNWVDHTQKNEPILELLIWLKVPF